MIDIPLSICEYYRALEVKNAYIILTVSAFIMASCDTSTNVKVNVADGNFDGSAAVISGGIIGAGLSTQEQDTLQQVSPKIVRKIYKGQRLCIDDIEAMSSVGFNDDLIIAQIYNTDSYFYLNGNQIRGLKNAGVSDNVIDYMIQTGTR